MVGPGTFPFVPFKETDLLIQSGTFPEGVPVLLVSAFALGAADAGSWRVLEATPAQRRQLERAGYKLTARRR